MLVRILAAATFFALQLCAHGALDPFALFYPAHLQGGQDGAERSLLEDHHLQGHAIQRCRTIAHRLLPLPSLIQYDACWREKFASNSTHEWAFPGAQVAAKTECWCASNLTEMAMENGCCEHEDFHPWCSTDCSPDCSSTLAAECITECPSMCFEASDYIVDNALCASCDWVKCWPVVQCLLEHGANLVQNGSLDLTCDEPSFRHDTPELDNYWACWNAVPKHSSHWNILSGIVHCSCREGMQDAVTRNHCCASASYGGGVCEVECVPEAECHTQAAQTCIHGCQAKCSTDGPAPSQQCRADCLDETAACRKYVSCRPPSATGYICDDGRWPDASSGCCNAEDITRMGCPRLCETQRTLRLDRRNGIPWWASSTLGQPHLVVQCACGGCPGTVREGVSRLMATIEDSIWVNGQSVLVEIARQESLQLGPNRAMQELMHRRNEEILQYISRNGSNAEVAQLDAHIEDINGRYIVAIRDAAQRYPDDGDGYGRASTNDDDETDGTLKIILVASACVSILAISIVVASCLCLKGKRHPTLTTLHNEKVVIGAPVVDPPSSAAVQEGTANAVTIDAVPATAATGKGKENQEGAPQGTANGSVHV